MFSSRVIGRLANLSPSTPKLVADTLSFGKRSDLYTSGQVPGTYTYTDTDDSERKIMVVKKSDDPLLIAADSATNAAVEAFMKDNEAAKHSRDNRATPAAATAAACHVNPIEKTKDHNPEVAALVIKENSEGYSHDKMYEELTDMQTQLDKLKQISACVSAEEAAIFDENIKKVTELLAVTLDKLGPDSSKPLFQGTAMEGTAMKGTTMDQILQLVKRVVPVKEFQTSLQKPSPQQLKELASYIVLKHKAMEVNKSTDDPAKPPYNGIPFYTEPSQQSLLQICFLPGETLEQELPAVSCAFKPKDPLRSLVITQRAFVSANPNIASMREQCECDLQPSSPLYHRRLRAQQLDMLMRTEDEKKVFSTTGVNGLVGLWASTSGAPTPPHYFSKLEFAHVPTLSDSADSADAAPPPPPPPPGDDPYTVLYDFTNKVGPRVSIPYIPANYPPVPFPDPDWSAPFPSVIVGRKRLLYSIGPILFDNNLFGRPLIMIRLHNYKTTLHPDGIYFWVYPSFSENGLARVYFTIDGGMILKGIDYTITTFVLEFLQVEINKYYVRHYVNKLPNNFFPTKLTTRLQILDFFGEMIHLQDQWVYDFLCGLGEITSPYVRDHAPIPPDFNRHCYVFYSNPCRNLAALPPPPAPPPAPPPSFPPFYPDKETSLNLDVLPIGAITPTDITTLRMCVSEGIKLAIIKTDRRRTHRECNIFASFMSMNAKYRGDSEPCTFPLRLCISTVMDKILVPVTGGDVNQQHLFAQNIVSDWPFTQWVQGCRDLGRCSISPVIVTIAGVTPDLTDLTNNKELATDGFAPQILAKNYSASRLLTISETHTPGQKYEFRRYLRSGAGFNPAVDLITLDPRVYPLGGFDSITNAEKIEKFNLLPSAIKTSVELMVDLFCNPDPVYDKVRVSFIKLLRIPGHTASQPLSAIEQLIATAKTSADAAARINLLNALKIHILTTSVSGVYRQDTQPELLTLRSGSPLDVIKQIMEVTGVYRYSIASSIFYSFLGIPGFQLTAPGGFPANEEVKFYYLDKLGQYRSIDPPLGGNPRDFSSCFTNPNFDPYIIDSVRDSEYIHPNYLRDRLLGRDITQPAELNRTINDVRGQGFINASKVFSKMFLLRLLFNNGGKKIQVIVSVSSTITISGNNRKYAPFATDLQFTPTFIGPVDDDGVGETLETIIATAVRYISAGCSVATKPADYSQLSGYAQILKYLEIYFRQFGSVCFTYNSSQIGPFNCLHDPMLKFLTCVFSNQDAINAITAKWNWIPYLCRQGYNLDAQSAIAGQTLEQNIQNTLRENRLRMLKVCEILIDPMLKILDTGLDHDVVNLDDDDDDDDDGSGSSGSDSMDRTGSSASSSVSRSEYSPPTLAGRSFSSQDSSTTFLSSHSPSSSVSVSPILRMVAHPGSADGNIATSVPPVEQTMNPGGGSLTNKKYTIKKHAHKSQNRSKSNNRKTTTTRKNLKFKRVIKKHTTKYKTYKRKAKGRKLRGNKYKNNKTMRRMRCVRK